MTVMNPNVSYAFPPHAVPYLPIRNSSNVFPVHRIYCVGRNYADHAIEMGHDPNREAPFFFQKNPDTLVLSGGVFPYPDKSNDVHHELEMVIALKSGGKDIPIEKALDHVYAYGVGLDMTRRDLQGEAKKAGRPWEIGKAFEYSAPCSELVLASEIGHPAKGAVTLKVNGAVKQKGDLDQLIWKVPEMISYLSGLFELKAGDLIYSGTPAGVGPVVRGDEMLGTVDGIGEIKIKVG
jgi:fumarylpyruvate hydrolase